MTIEHLKYIEFASLVQLRLLKKVKELYHQNKWTEEFDEVFQETISKLIWDIENLFLLPVYNFNPIQRNFKEEDEHLRIEISKEVNIYFKGYKQTENNTNGQRTNSQRA